MTKTLLRASLLSVLFLFLGLAGRAGELDLDFKLVNKTGYAIKKIYLSPTKADEWGENVVKGGLKDGQSADISFHPAASAAKWDLKVEWAAPYESDPAVEWHGFKLTDISKITLRYNKQTDETSAVTE